MAFESLIKLADEYKAIANSLTRVMDADLKRCYLDDVAVIEAVSFNLTMGQRLKAFAILDEADTAIRESIEVALMQYPDVYNDWKKLGGGVV